MSQDHKHEAQLIALQSRIIDLETALGQRGNYGQVFRLPTSLARLFGLLVAVPAVNQEMVQQQLEIVTDVKVAMHRLRQHLDRWAAANEVPLIEVKSRRTLGYWLEPEVKARIKLLVAVPAAAAVVASEGA